MSKKIVHYDHIPVEERRHHYSIIYADVPMKYDNQVDKAHGGVSYTAMDTEELCRLPVKEIANPKGCLLFMWCFMPKIPQIIQIMEAWGFTYVTCVFVWVKTNRKNQDTLFSGCGYYSRSNAELCLLGRMGKAPTLLDRTIKQIVMSPMIGHSIKPQEVRRRINQMYGDKIPKIELFARVVGPNDPSGREETKHIGNFHFHGDNDFGDDSNKAKRIGDPKSKVKYNEIDTNGYNTDSDYSDYSDNSNSTRSRSKSRSRSRSVGTNSDSDENDYSSDGENTLLSSHFGQYQRKNSSKKSRNNNRRRNNNY